MNYALLPRLLTIARDLGVGSEIAGGSERKKRVLGNMVTKVGELKLEFKWRFEVFFSIMR